MNKKKVAAFALMIGSPLSVSLVPMLMPQVILVLGGVLGLALLGGLVILIPLLLVGILGLPVALALAA